MERSEKKKSMVKRSILILFILFMTVFFVIDSPVYAEWSFGIGTGISQMKVDGEQGFHTDLAGPIKYDVKLDPEDFNDLIDTAIGFGGFATDGTWLIQYSYGKIELEGRESTAVPALDSRLSARIGFDITGAELTVGYPVFKTPSFILHADGGVRYTKHEFDSRLKLINSSGTVVASRKRNFDHSWTDAVVGGTINVPFAKTWSWITRLNAGFGGSEGTYFASTGVTWRFHKNWSAGIIGKYMAVEYENDSKGDRDWYLYDADESSVGINVLFIF